MYCLYSAYAEKKNLDCLLANRSRKAWLNIKTARGSLSNTDIYVSVLNDVFTRWIESFSFAIERNTLYFCETRVTHNLWFFNITIAYDNQEVTKGGTKDTEKSPLL